MSCPDCFTGHEHAGTPQGAEEPSLLHGVRTYVSRPPAGQQPKGVVLFLPDMFGWAAVNNRLLCDAYAEKGGFVVYLPDFMAGEFFFLGWGLGGGKRQEGIYHFEKLEREREWFILRRAVVNQSGGCLFLLWLLVLGEEKIWR